MTQSLCGKTERSSHVMGMERRLAAILSADVQGAVSWERMRWPPFAL